MNPGKSSEEGEEAKGMKSSKNASQEKAQQPDPAENPQFLSPCLSPSKAREPGFHNPIAVNHWLGTLGQGRIEKERWVPLALCIGVCVCVSLCVYVCTHNGSKGNLLKIVASSSW